VRLGKELIFAGTVRGTRTAIGSQEKVKKDA